MTYHTFYIDSGSFLWFAAFLGPHLSSLTPDPQGLPFTISIPGIDCEKLDLAEVEVLDLIVVGQESPPESETLALMAAGKSSSPECEMLEAVGKRTSSDIETPVLVATDMGTIYLIERLIEIGQIKQGKQQARYHLLKCRLWKPQFWHSDVGESPPHSHDFQAPGTPYLIPLPRGPAEEAPPLEAENRGRSFFADPATHRGRGEKTFFSIIICFECIFY